METCCAALAAIARYCAAAALGLAAKLYIIEVCDVESIPAAAEGDHRITGDIVLKAGKVWHEWNIGDTDAEYGYVSAGQSGSESFNSTLTYFIPVIRSLVDHLLNNILNGRFLVVFVDKDGQKMLLGTLFNPVKFVPGGVSGVVSGEANGTTCSMQQLGGKTAHFYDGAIVTTVV